MYVINHLIVFVILFVCVAAVPAKQVVKDGGDSKSGTSPKRTVKAHPLV